PRIARPGEPPDQEDERGQERGVDDAPEDRAKARPSHRPTEALRPTGDEPRTARPPLSRGEIGNGGNGPPAREDGGGQGDADDGGEPHVGRDRPGADTGGRGPGHGPPPVDEGQDRDDLDGNGDGDEDG